MASSMDNWAPWKHEMAGLAVLYHMAVLNNRIPLVTAGDDFEFIDPLLSRMYNNGLIDVTGQYWGVTDKGKQVIRTAIQIYDHLLKFAIFGKVNLKRQLTPEEESTQRPCTVWNNVYDPRFGIVGTDQPGEWEDLRLAVMTFLQEKGEQKMEPLDPHRVVFIQKLDSGLLKRKDFWLNLRLGRVFQEIEDIVASSVKWRDVADSEDDAVFAMQVLYTCGMVEQRKRDGKECSGCGTPLAMFEAEAAEQGKRLSTCPNPDCNASFDPPPPSGFECPRCHATVTRRQKVCSCGAHLDYSMPPGTIQEETVAETTEEEYSTVWGVYYDPLFVPYGYYDPYAWTVADALAFGVVCAILW